MLRHWAIRCPRNSQQDVVHTGHSQGRKSLGCPGDLRWDCGTDRTLGQLPRVGVLGMSRGPPMGLWNSSQHQEVFCLQTKNFLIPGCGTGTPEYCAAQKQVLHLFTKHRQQQFCFSPNMVKLLYVAADVQGNISLYISPTALDE